MTFVKKLLSGPDNETPAIGRVLGVGLFINMIITVPAIVVGALWTQKVPPPVWFALLAALQVYVPLMCVAAAGMVAGTAFTEPTAKSPPTGESQLT